MVNFGLNSASILGIFLAVAGAGLYFMRTIRPELSRDHDIFFAAVGLLCGFILLFQGWRLDPILQFGQFLLTGAAVFFAFETIKLRGVATEQARRNSPVVDDERPVSRVYRAELDQLEPYESDEPYDNNPRLRGYDEPRNSRSSKYDSDEPRSTRTRPTSERSSSERPSKDTQKQRRTRPSSQTQNSSYNEWNDSSATDWEEPPTRETRRRRPSSDVGDQQPTRQSSRKRPTRPPENRPQYQDEAPAPYVDYVDYQPVDEDKEENWEQPTKPKSSPERNESNDDNSVRFDY